MAGYFRRAEAWNYEGSYKAGEELENGRFVTIVNGLVRLNTIELPGSTFWVKEKTTLWGEPALVLTCITPAVGYFFTENEFEDYGDTDFDPHEYYIQEGEYVKMRTPNFNDELILTVDNELYDSVTVGRMVHVDGGTVALTGTN